MGKKQSKPALVTAGPYLGYMLAEQKWLYIYHIPTGRGTRHFVEIEKLHGADDLIVGTTYYMIGGHESPTLTVAIDLENKDHPVSKRANLNIGRVYSTSTALDTSHIYTIGGCGTGGTLSSCERFNIRSNRWEHAPTLNIPRDCATLGTVDYRYIYAIEGRSQGAFLRSAERLDSLDLEVGWEMLPELAGAERRTPRGGCLCLQKSVGELLIAGGSCHFDGQGFDDVYVMRTEGMTWKEYYGKKLPRGGEFYPPVPLFRKRYYQLAYSYESPDFDLITFNTISGQFGEVKESLIWRKLSG